MLLIITATKMFIIAGTMVTLAGAALGTGVLFGSYILSVAKNPEESENLFNTTLMGFALIETFVFLSFLVVGLSFILV